MLLHAFNGHVVKWDKLNRGVIVSKAGKPMYAARRVMNSSIQFMAE